MPYVTAGGERLFYLHRFSNRAHGPVLLLLHGAGGHALLWGRVLNELPGIAAIALDLPGHGRSAGPGRASIAAYSAAVLAAADALHLERPVITGHSMGAAIALDLAASQPSRLRALVLMSAGASLASASALHRLAAEDPAAAGQWLVDHGYGPGTPAESRKLAREQLATVPPDVLRGDFAACSAYDARPRLAEIPHPALILCGAEDRLTPPEDALTLQQGLQQGRLELIPGAGHMLPLEHPGAVARAIARFLASLDDLPLSDAASE